MSSLKINITEVRETNLKLKKCTSNVISVKMEVSSLRYRVDSRILARRNIGERINDTVNSLNEIEYKLRSLESAVNNCMDIYCAAEDHVGRQASSLTNLIESFNINGNNKNKKKSNAELLWEKSTRSFLDIKKSVQKEYKHLEIDTSKFIDHVNKSTIKTFKEIEKDWSEGWEYYKTRDPIMAGITAGGYEVIKSLTYDLAKFFAVDLVKGVFTQINEFIKDPMKKLEDCGEACLTIKAIVSPQTPEEQALSNRVANGIWLEIKGDFEKEVINGNTYTRTKYITGAAGTIASFFVVVGEAEAAETGAKATEASFKTVVAAEDANKFVQINKIAVGAVETLDLVKTYIKTKIDAIFEIVQETKDLGNKILFKLRKGVSDVEVIEISKSELTENEIKFCLEGCFTGNTLVVTKKGLKRIDSIQEGDLILSKNIETEEIEYKPALYVYKKNTKSFINLTISGKLIEATPSHLFMIEDWGWKSAENLKAGDKILTADGEIKNVDYVEAKYYDSNIPIFNLNIDEYHTYFVSDFKLLVHNDCVKPEVNAIGGIGNAERVLKTTDELLNETTCSKNELYQYLKSNDDYFKTNYAEQFMETGKWPDNIQIPKSSDVLTSKGSIDWEQVHDSGYVLDNSGKAIKDIYFPKKGEIIDRFGPSDGTFTSPVIGGKPYSYDSRSLPYLEDLRQYHQYELTDDLNKLGDCIKNCNDKDLVQDINDFMAYKKIKSYDDLISYKGEIASGFGASGGGIQYQLPLPVDILEELGLLKIIE